MEAHTVRLKLYDRRVHSIDGLDWSELFVIPNYYNLMTYFIVA